jgi:hypothetical protein
MYYVNQELMVEDFLYDDAFFKKKMAGALPPGLI